MIDMFILYMVFAFGATFGAFGAYISLLLFKPEKHEDDDVLH